MQPGVSIRAIQQSDWIEYRRLRLQMLAEIPIAFGETLEHAQAMSEQQWMTRVHYYVIGSSPRLGAVEDATGRWVGTMGGFISPEDGYRPVLVGVYVDPEYRGSSAGVTDAMLRIVEDWARPHGDSLLLHVHEDNGRARAAYARRGFVEDGVTLPYPLDRTRVEYEMVKRL